MTLRPNFQYWPHKGNRLQTAPTVEPVSLEQLRNHLRVTHNDEDEYINDLIKESRKFIEDNTNIAFNDQTWLLTFDAWPGYQEPWWDGTVETTLAHIQTNRPRADITFPRYPLSSITSVTVYDEDSNATVVTVASKFDVDTNSIPGRMTLKRGQTWPIATRSNNAIEIVYVAGYGSAAENVPAPLARSILEMAAYFYDHRGSCDVGEAYEKSGASSIANRYRAKLI